MLAVFSLDDIDFGRAMAPADTGGKRARGSEAGQVQDLRASIGEIKRAVRIRNLREVLARQISQAEVVLLRDPTSLRLQRQSTYIGELALR